jgi:HopJ type III effector protein
MALNEFIDKIKQGDAVGFQDTMAVIAEHYDYQPTEFSNGLDDDIFVNLAGTNEGSCKIFAFAKLNHLDKQQTLSLFGDYYRLDVLQHPAGTDHRNIRNFMKYGWEGLCFSGGRLSLQIKSA